MVEQGVIFIDTAGVCGDGRSEQFVGQFRKNHLDKKLFIATKMGRGGSQIFR
ncbi:aldo/keto reductase [Alloscardovia omnicolens]|uniref:aldo/keto reductase n=1 Tax=Alloscardovia TaxID=419014 RepID=UPI00210FE148|nr:MULTISPECIES: aldo/keto reductase [Alloscardovia]MDK6663982.1 aldo/keto reductase [Alloscardovia omnicolens]MDK7748339.1 aldo/keto reductase [Alloscardovia omnicolens]